MRLHTTLAAIAALILSAGSYAAAVTTQIDVTPSMVPDETAPRVNFGDAPTGYGPNSWQGPATGKTNWHARYQADGDALSALFPDDAASMTINDLSEISYYTKRPSGTQSGRDWWVQIYTRPQSGNSEWYQERFINNYNDHTDTGNWVNYSTTSGMTFNHNGSKVGTNDANGEMTLSGLQTNYGTELIEMISVQTNTGWDGYDGYMDGLQISLINGNVGQVNFEPVPEPLTMLGVFSGVVGIGAYIRKRRTA